jgi:hypothetical protein
LVHACGLTLRSTGRAGTCRQLGERRRGPPVSLNVRRHMFDETKYDEVVAHVTALATAAGAVEVRHHFAGYFDELGLWVRFEPSTVDLCISTAGNQLLAYLHAALPHETALFTWVLSLERGSDTVNVFVPGDCAQDVDAPLSVLK